MEGVEAEAAQAADKKAEIGGRGATEFGRARERSAAKLPLPAAAEDVDQKSRRLKGKHRFYHRAAAPRYGGRTVWGGAKRGEGTTGGKQWLPGATANTPANGEAERLLPSSSRSCNPGGCSWMMFKKEGGK